MGTTCFRRLLIVILTALMTAVVLTTPALGATSWIEKRGSQATLYYHPGEEANVAGVLETFEQALPELQSKLGIRLSYQPRVYLVSSQEEFDRVTGGRLPPWSQGVSFPETGSIVLKSPSFSHDIGTYNRTALHEMAHLLIGYAAGPGLPRWINEGLALLLSGEGPGKALMPLSHALWTGGLMTLGEVERVDAFDQARAELAYLQSYNATEYLLKQYGWEGLRRLLREVGQGKSWDDALSQVVGTDQAGFEASWHTALERSYRWVILMDVQIYIFLGITLLVLLAGIAVLRRRRKIYKQWEAEEGITQGIF